MGPMLQDKIIVVTGGASGIGRETALGMAREGATVVVCDRAVEAGNAVLAEIEAAGGQGMFHHADVTSTPAVEKMFDAVIKRYGRLDCAFNNAGIEGTYGFTAEATDEDWARTLAVNLTGVFVCMRREIREMLKTGGGAIVNTASVTGLVGWRGAPAYSASKHAVVGLTKTAALEYARQGIRVNAVCPGVIATPMGERVSQENFGAREKLIAKHPVGRLGESFEVAKAVIWLCSGASSFTTGHALTVDGGLVAR